ncbi:hypothetical protein DY000_02042547 [Brassica cretica]|uniref:Uncharacterized protein n=1 Tax=Brassica cretica TaxID=69181 RepID=A0ABQ7BNN0_BRACR|nr:hypothetical protein DY000_02042547 [Brassica cretica]
MSTLIDTKKKKGVLREGRKVDPSSGPVIGRRVSVRAVTGASKATVKSPRSSLCRRPLPPPPCLSSGRRSSMADLAEAPSAPSTPVQVPARWRLRLAPPSSVKIMGGEGTPCLASPSVSSLV